MPPKTSRQTGAAPMAFSPSRCSCRPPRWRSRPRTYLRQRRQGVRSLVHRRGAPPRSTAQKAGSRSLDRSGKARPPSMTRKSPDRHQHDKQGQVSMGTEATGRDDAACSAATCSAGSNPAVACTPHDGRPSAVWGEEG